MKKVILLTTALAITCSTIIAQKSTFGITLGVQQTAPRIHIDDEDDDANYTVESPGTGFNIGAVADIKLSSKFSLRPNLLLSYKGGRAVFFGSGKYSQMSIDLPINALYHTNSFFIGVGPNISYGISAKVKPFEDGEEDFDLYKEEDGEDAFIKRFEIGVNGLMGYQFPGGFTLSVNYTRGLNNLFVDDETAENASFNHRAFGLNFAYMFGAKK